MKTVAIIEGFAGGPKHTKLFRKALLEEGFEIIKKPKEADVIIAHSTGCYDLPLLSKAKVFVLIGPPYWPGESLLIRGRRKHKFDKEFILKNYGKRHWRIKKLWAYYYIIAKPHYMWLVLRNKSKLEFLERVESKKLILIRNRQDKYCSPEISKSIETNANVEFYEMPGGHDDYYTNPKPYIDLLLKEL